MAVSEQIKILCVKLGISVSELISQGSTVILAGPSEMETRTAAEALNQAMQRQQDKQQ